MIEARFLEILACPVTKTPLHLADDELIEQLNVAIGQGQVMDRMNKKVESPIEAGLVCEGDRFFYRIEDDIPVLLPEEAIALDQVGQGLP